MGSNKLIFEERCKPSLNCGPTKERFYSGQTQRLQLVMTILYPFLSASTVKYNFKHQVHSSMP